MGENKSDKNEIKQMFFSVKELQKYLGISLSTAYKLKKEIPYYKINNNVKFKISDVEDWLAKNVILP